MYLYFTNNGSRSIKYSKHNIQQNKRVLSSKSSAAGVASDKRDAIIIIIFKPTGTKPQTGKLS